MNLDACEPPTICRLNYQTLWVVKVQPELEIVNDTSLWCWRFPWLLSEKESQPSWPTTVFFEVIHVQKCDENLPAFLTANHTGLDLNSDLFRSKPFPIFVCEKHHVFFRPEKQHATFQKCIGQYLACLSKFKPWRFPILRWVTHAGANGAKWASISFGWIMGHLCGRMSEAPNKSESMGSNLVSLLGANCGHKFQGISINYCLVVGPPILSRFLFMAIYFSGIS